MKLVYLVDAASLRAKRKNERKESSKAKKTRLILPQKLSLLVDMKCQPMISLALPFH
jgi:hypothetical protein